MKKLLTVSILALFAVNASAQVVRPDRNGIVYSMNPLPPIVSNNRISFAPGAPYVDRSGVMHACSTPLVYDHSDGATRATCGDQQAANANTADALANLAPAAGGRHTLSDRNLSSDNLSSDSSSGLRNDRSIIQ